MASLRPIAASLVLAAAVAGGCGADPTGTPIGAARPDSLDGSAWQLVSIAGNALPPGPEVTVQFRERQLDGAGPCNDYGASFAYEPSTGALRIGSLESTKRACVDQTRGSAETAFFAGLRGARAASIDPSGRLVVSGTGALLVFVVGPRPSPPAVPVSPGPS